MAGPVLHYGDGVAIANAPKIHAWLPETALNPVRLAATLSADIDAWADDWFAAWRIQPIVVDKCTSVADKPDRAEKRQIKPGLTLTISQSGCDILAAELFGIDWDRFSPRPADRRPVDDAASTCLDDLCDRIRRTMPDDNRSMDSADSDQGSSAIPQAQPAQWSAALHDKQGRDIAQIGIAHDFLLDYSRAAIPPSRCHRTLTDRGDALLASCVALGARIGGATLSLAEIAACEPGDVVILDRMMADRVQLTVNDLLLPTTGAQIDRHGDAVRLAIHSETP
ncbi:MAG: FliM/FliN family flagellar motor switch protein [Pseudomonadota bacterium]